MFEFHKTTNNENIEFKVTPRKENSNYEYDKDKSYTFKGRLANTREKKLYRLQQGVNTNSDSVYIYATNLPNGIRPGDQVQFLGQIQTIKSVGFYYDVNGIVNESLFSDEYIEAQCPKGLACE